MTAELKTIDPALDRVLAAASEPMVPAGLAGRITAEAVAKPQRKPNGLLRSRRTRPERTRRGRPVILGSIGVGFMAVSAVAAALVSEGRLDVTALTEPIAAVFRPSPEPPQRVAETPEPRQPIEARTQVSAEAPDIDADTAAGVAAQAGTRHSLTPLQRAFVVRQRLRRQALARRMAVATPAERQVIRRRVATQSLRRAAFRRASLNNPDRPVQRLREAVRSGELTPAQRERIQALRERRARRLEAADTPAVLQQRLERIEARRARLGELRRERLGIDRPQQPAVRPSAADLSGPAASPFRPLPAENQPNALPSPPADIPISIRPNRADGPPPEIMGPAPRPPAAAPDRPRVVPPVERARRAAQRRANQRQRPRRPRIPRRRR